MASPYIYENPMFRAAARLRLQRVEEERARARKVESETSTRAREADVRAATASTAHWLQGFTKTYNPHWQEEGRPSPHEAFPQWPFFEIVLDIIERERITAIEKSRDMMASWAVCGYFTLQAMLVPEREIVFQTMTDEKAWQLIDYCKTLYAQQPAWLREAFPLAKPIEKQSKGEFLLKHGAQIVGIPGGKGKIRSFHPWGYFSDETGFQPEAGHCLDEALGAGCLKVVLASTAGTSWYSDWRMDVTL